MKKYFLRSAFNSPMANVNHNGFFYFNFPDFFQSPRPDDVMMDLSLAPNVTSCLWIKFSSLSILKSFFLLYKLWLFFYYDGIKESIFYFSWHKALAFYYAHSIPLCSFSPIPSLVWILYSFLFTRRKNTKKTSSFYFFYVIFSHKKI